MAALSENTTTTNATTMNAGIPAHMSVISARCPYLTGHIEAARKSSTPDVPKAVVLCLEHASAETVPLLVRYLYTDAFFSKDISGGTLDALAGLAQELMLPRYCIGAIFLGFFGFFGTAGGRLAGGTDYSPLVFYLRHK